MWSINGINYSLTEAQRSSVLIDACTQLGIDVPRFCYHENLKIAGNCRMCLIEDSKAPKPVICCASNPLPELSIFTNTLQVKKSREAVMEFLLINHPLDCPICDQGGECDLQDLALVYGSDSGRFYEYKRNVEDKNFGPVIKTVMNRCIQCTRCVRFATDVAGLKDLGMSGRGGKIEIGSYIEKVLNSDLSGNLIDVCPVGALTSKPYAFVSRPWELKKTNFLALLDDQPQVLRADIKENEIVRYLPSKNQANSWITNRLRFSYEGLSRNRLTLPLIFGREVTWALLLNVLKLALSSIRNSLPLVASNIFNFQLQERLALSYENLAAIKNFLMATASKTSSNELNFTFLPRSVEWEDFKGSNFVFLATSLAFELPIISTLIASRLSTNSGLIISWRSALTPLLFSSSAILNSSAPSLLKFIKAKTWLNFLSPLTGTLYFYSLAFSSLFSSSLGSSLSSLIINGPSIRSCIDLGVGCFTSPLTSFSILNYHNGPTYSNSSSLISLAHLTHIDNNSFSIFALPNKDYLETGGEYYGPNYSSLKVSRVLSPSKSCKSTVALLAVLSKIFNLNVTKSNTAPLSSTSAPLVPNSRSSSWSATYFFLNTLYKKVPLSSFLYYTATPLLVASPTLAAISLNSSSNNIY